ncbi:MAG: cytidylate kinase family protein [Clostridia bacterium]
MGNGYKLALSGDLGSGKSTVTKLLIDNFGFETFSTGTYQRAMAKRMHMSTLELNQYAETHPEIDQEIDAKLTEEGRKPGNIIFDSRMAWHFVENAFKVYLISDVNQAAARVYCDSKNGVRGNVERYASVEEAKEYILNRRASEVVRYQEKYGVDITDMSNYDLVIDATHMTIVAIAEKTYEEMVRWYGR